MGFKHSEETKNKLSLLRKEYYRTHPHPRGMLGKTHSKEVREIISNTHKGTKWTDERTKKRIESRHINTPEWIGEEGRKKMSITQKKLWANGTYSLEKQGVRGRELFKTNNPMKNPIIAAKTIFNRYNGEPSKYEKIFISIVKKYNFPYEYTGNGKLIVLGKCPDFKHCSENKLIELVDNRNLKRTMVKKELFERNGWKCLIINNIELLKEDILIEKIKNF